MYEKVSVAVVLSATLTSGTFAQEKSGAFVGVIGGLGGVIESVRATATVQGQQASLTKSDTQFSITTGAKAGFQFWFSPLFGLRAYFQYDYTRGPYYVRTKQTTPTTLPTTELIRLDFHQFTGNADLMLNFVNTESFSLGAFAGLGLGYTLSLWSDSDVSKQLEKTTNYSGFALPINVGISTTFAQDYKLELGARIYALPVFYETKTADLGIGSSFGFGMATGNIGYTYIF